MHPRGRHRARPADHHGGAGDRGRRDDRGADRPPRPRRRPEPPTTTEAPTTTRGHRPRHDRRLRTTAAPGIPSDVEGIIRYVWPDELEERALAIAYRESRYVPTAYNGWCCYGLFQIYFNVNRSFLAGQGVTSADQLLDAYTNARVAYAMYQASGWAPWATTDPVTDGARTDQVASARWALDSRGRTEPALVAQWIEHLTTDQKVGGSTPSERADHRPWSRRRGRP